MDQDFKHILIYGAGSKIATELACELAQNQENDFFLIAHTKKSIDNCVDQLIATNSKVNIQSLIFDPKEPHDFKLKLSPYLKNNYFDLIIIAIGNLIDSHEQDLNKINDCIDINFKYPTLFIHEVLSDLKQNHPCTIAVISSVAGDRVRASNYMYGSSKMALSNMILGIEAYLKQNAMSDIKFAIIKPGLVATPMIENRQDRRLVSNPKKVAQYIIKSLKKGKHIIYAPPYWKWIMLIIKSLPNFIFKKIKS